MPPAGLLSHLLVVGGRAPNKLLISKESGKVHQLEFYATYNGEGMLERSDPVPFRLTKNLQEFFTHYGVEGWFVSTLAAGADVSPPPPLCSISPRDCVTAIGSHSCACGPLKDRQLNGMHGTLGPH